MFSRSVKRTVGYAVAGFAAAQATAITAVIIGDELRKRRSPQSGEFPRTEPVTVTGADSELTVFTYGADLYEDMLEEIANAQTRIFFETFIWKPGVVGRRFKQALVAAAKRGVEVYVIVDRFGNLNVLDYEFKSWPDIAGLHVMKFPLIRPGIVIGNLRQTGRDHRKLLIVDSRVAYVGGYNIGDMYATTWRDTHIKVEGDAAWELENSFIDFWNDHRERKVHDRLTGHALPELPDKGARRWDSRVEAASNSPYRMLFPVRGMYCDALDRANSHAYITMGYFIPDREILRALIGAANRGVTVKVLIPEYSNHILADWAARPYYSDLMEAGVELWLFQEAMVHAKTMTVDGRWTTIGTTNIDRLSMTGNFEVNLEVHSTELAEHMEKVFEVDLTNSRLLTCDEWECRRPIKRLGERLIRPLGALL